MIVPGFITLYSFAVIFHCVDVFTGGNRSVANYICIFALSYLLGLLIHKFSQLLMDRKLRNNPNHIKEMAKKFEEDRVKREGGNKKEIGDGIEGEYYEKYYQIIDYSPSIPTMEVQVSFARSMIVVILLVVLFLAISLVLHMFCVYMCGGCVGSCMCQCMDADITIREAILISVLLVFKCLLWLIAISIQKKIYYCVFEDFYYKSKLELLGLKNPNNTKAESHNDNIQ